MESENSFLRIEKELTSLLKKLKNGNSEPSTHNSKTMTIRILNSITYSMEAIEKWDCNTSYCRKFGWGTLTKAISNGEDVENLLTALHPFVTEYVLSKEIDFNDDIHDTLEYIEEHIDSLPYKTKSTLERTKRNLIFDIYRDRFNDENVAVTRKFISASRDVNEFENKWKDLFVEKEEKIAGLESRLVKLREKYNFIGLKNGFAEIKKTKKIEKWLSFTLMFIFFILIIAPVVYEAIRLNKLTEEEKFSFLNLVPLIPIISLDFLLIYFFRVVLHNYQSAKDQLVQIDLRVNMCAFIDGYVDFKDRMIKDEKKISLDTFEKLMFSNIATTGKDIPSTYDGLESLAKIISAARK